MPATATKKPTNQAAKPPARITPKHDPFAKLKPRDEKVWKEFPKAITVACPTCGAKKGEYCRDKKSLRTPHKPRRAA